MCTEKREVLLGSDRSCKNVKVKEAVGRTGSSAITYRTQGWGVMELVPVFRITQMKSPLAQIMQRHVSQKKTRLTGLISLESSVGLMPKCFAVFLQFEEAGLLPGA